MPLQRVFDAALLTNGALHTSSCSDCLLFRSDVGSGGWAGVGREHGLAVVHVADPVVRVGREAVRRELRVHRAHVGQHLEELGSSQCKNWTDFV